MNFLLFVFVDRTNPNCVHFTVHLAAPWTLPLKAAEPFLNPPPPQLRSWLKLDSVWNVMAHVQKPDFVFRRKGRVHLNRRGRKFSRILAAEMCASAVVMLDTPCSEVVWRAYLGILESKCVNHCFPLYSQRGVLQCCGPLIPPDMASNKVRVIANICFLPAR